jgi:hypothetical protein
MQGPKRQSRTSLPRQQQLCSQQTEQQQLPRLKRPQHKQINIKLVWKAQHWMSPCLTLQSLVSKQSLQQSNKRPQDSSELCRRRKQ